ncbi:MAG: 16S rRNA (uracil(1498)-N(3))-methyltransferase [Candidatus Magasanikbacteria bacterium]
MAKHRFIRKNFDFSGGSLLIDDRRLVHQINNVLRMSSGDKIILCDGENEEAEGLIREINKEEIVVEILDKYKNDREPKTQVTLYCSILKNRNYDLVVEKATEVGVNKIVPIISERTVKTGLKTGRLKKKIREAAELSNRGKLPQLEKKIDFQEALNMAQNIDTKVLFDHSGQKTNFYKQELSSASVFVGPEGGWTESEVSTAREKDFKIAKLGDLNMRTETAAIVGSYEILK